MIQIISGGEEETSTVSKTRVSLRAGGAFGEEEAMRTGERERRRLAEDRAIVSVAGKELFRDGEDDRAEEGTSGGSRNRELEGTGAAGEEGLPDCAGKV